MQIAAAQADFNRAFAAGAAGVLVSGLVWIAAGLAWTSLGVHQAFVVLFLGGIVIHPLATVLCRFALRCSPAEPGNPLTRLALESTVALFAGVIVAYVLLMRQPELAIPAFAVIMGARYFTFRTLYGSALYWALGGVIALVGTLALFSRAIPFGNLATQVGLIELVFAALLFAGWRRVGR